MVVAAAQGDRQLLQGTVDELRLVNSPCGASQVGELIQEPAGRLPQAPIGLTGQRHKRVHGRARAVVLGILLVIPQRGGRTGGGGGGTHICASTRVDDGDVSDSEAARQHGEDVTIHGAAGPALGVRLQVLSNSGLPGGCHTCPSDDPAPC